MEAAVYHGDALEGHLGQAPRHVQVGQHTCRVAGLQEDQVAVVPWIVIGVLIDDGDDE